MTPEPPAPAAARDAFVTYDELGGPDLGAAQWSPRALPLPTSGEHIPLDPNAELVVADGEVRLAIPRFSLSHDRFQAAEQLGLGGGRAGEPFYYVVESPYEDFDDDFTRARACEITLDAGGGSA